MTDLATQSLGRKRSLLVEHAMKAADAGEIDKTELVKASYHIADQVIRTDSKEVSQELTPELRARLATAALNILEPPMRNDEDVKSPFSGEPGTQPKPRDKPGSSPLNRKDDEEEKPRRVQDDDNAPSLKTVMDAIGKLNKRFDDIELSERDGDDDGEKPKTEEGTPKDLAADAAVDSYRRNARFLKKGELGRITCDSVTMDEFVKAQARADRVYSAWGKSAPKPQHGEELNAYRRRLIVPYQHYSPTFKKANLKVVAVEDLMFNHVEEEIWKAAFDAVHDPSTVPLGILREEVTTRNGHTTTKFHGRPLSWMAAFAPPGKRIRRITERNDSYNGGVRVIYEPQARA